VNSFCQQVSCEMTPGPGGGFDHSCIVADALDESWRMGGIPTFERSDQSEFPNGGVGRTTGNGTIL
jgi:hypothetical protein